MILVQGNMHMGSLRAHGTCWATPSLHRRGQMEAFGISPLAAELEPCKVSSDKGEHKRSARKAERLLI